MLITAQTIAFTILTMTLTVWSQTKRWERADFARCFLVGVVSQVKITIGLSFFSVYVLARSLDYTLHSLSLPHTRSHTHSRTQIYVYIKPYTTIFSQCFIRERKCVRVRGRAVIKPLNLMVSKN